MMIGLQRTDNIFFNESHKILYWILGGLFLFVGIAVKLFIPNIISVGYVSLEVFLVTTGLVFLVKPSRNIFMIKRTKFKSFPLFIIVNGLITYFLVSIVLWFILWVVGRYLFTISPLQLQLYLLFYATIFGIILYTFMKYNGYDRADW